MVEGARLERVYTGNRIEGSNPSLSAILIHPATGHAYLDTAYCFDDDIASAVAFSLKVKKSDLDMKPADAGFIAFPDQD